MDSRLIPVLRVHSLWPAFWMMGNLARPGYGGTTDGMWPYSYDTCDIGTLANQTLDGQSERPVTSICIVPS